MWFWQSANALFHCVHLMEYVLRICVDPRGYWSSPLNVLSAFVLLLSSVCMTLSVSLKHLICIYVLLVFRLRNYTDVEQVVIRHEFSISLCDFCHQCLCRWCLSGVHGRHLEGAEESQLDVFLDLCDRAGFLNGWALVFWRPKQRSFRTLGRPRHSPVHALQTARSKMSTDVF